MPDPTPSAPASSDPIDQILLKMDEIVAWCIANASRAGYFAALYRRVTRTVRSKIGTGYFDDDARMETLDVTFATRYLTAFHQWQTGDPAISACWQVAFDAIASLLACLVPTVFSEIGALSPLIHLVEDLAGPDEEKLVDVVMEFARDFSWLLANELVIL